MMVFADPEALLEKAGQGDSSAIEELLSSHRESLERMIAARIDKRLRARVDASDVVQEVFTAAAQALPEFCRDRPLPFIAWLRQIAAERLAKLHRRHIVAQRRSVSREAGLPPGFADESVQILARRLISSGLSPSQEAMKCELQSQVRDAMERLSAADRNLLVMRYVDRMAIAEVAGVLGISESAAKVRHLRTLRRLRSLLEPAQ